MSGPEEETYSTMFTSLRHPVRRKILRMLSEEPKSFSKMLEQLRVSSSNLTYHLENLGELVSKMEDGTYRLSTFGEAAVATMSSVEEAPKTTEPRHASSPRKKVSTTWVMLIIGIVTLASVCIVQYRVLNQLSVDYEKLKAEHAAQYHSLTKLSGEYEQLKVKYEEIVTGERHPEAWERTIHNLLKFEQIKEKANPSVEELKDEGIPIWDVTTATDKTGHWIKLFVLVGETRPEYEAKVMEIFGPDVPVAFHQMDEETWVNLSKAHSYMIIFDISTNAVSFLITEMPSIDR